MVFVLWVLCGIGNWFAALLVCLFVCLLACFVVCVVVCVFVYVCVCVCFCLCVSSVVLVPFLCSSAYVCV